MNTYLNDHLVADCWLALVLRTSLLAEEADRNIFLFAILLSSFWSRHFSTVSFSLTDQYYYC